MSNIIGFRHRIAFGLLLAGSVASAGLSYAQDQKAVSPKVTATDAAGGASTEMVAGASEETQKLVEDAIAKGDAKLGEEADRVPGLSYEDIARLSNEIPGRVQIPDPTSKDFSSRAISVPGGLVTEECKHFARGFIAKRLMEQNPNLGQEEATGMVISHLETQRVAYAKLAGKEGLKRSDVAIHDAECPICGPLNAAEIQCHKNAVKNSPIRELVMFDFGSNVLRGGHFSTIRKMKSLVEADPNVHIALIGRSSFPGDPVPNFALSSKRIASVWRGMTKTGIPVDRIVAIPIGEDEPHIDLQLAIDYGLEAQFASLGEQTMNQSVYLVAFRPDGKMSLAAVDILNADDKNEVSMEPKTSAKSDVEVAAISQRRERVREVQQLLNKLGFDAGPVDGIVGPKTLGGLKRYQADRGIGANEQINTELLTALRSDKELTR